jgi:hypothetical protein
MKSNVISTGDRYRLLRTAQGVLAKSGLTWKEQHRTCWCSRSLLYGDCGEQDGGRVDFYHNEARTSATMRGLQRCGNLHTCPICSAKVGELRRKQLSAAMTRQVANKGTAYLLTFTFPHERCEHGDGETCEFCLPALLEKFEKAISLFTNSRQWKYFRKAKRVVGSVRSREATVSLENGWHPHIHQLTFCDKNAFNEGAPAENGDLNSLEIEELSRLWCDKLFKVGLGENSKLYDMLKHAFNVRGGEQAAEYIAKFGHDSKWGASAELAKSHSKTGAAGERWGVMHFTPFQLLMWIENDNEGRGWAVHRFREYAKALEGKRALTWSPGLKSALDVLDVDEEEWIKTDQPPLPEQIYVGYLTAEQFSIIIARKHLPDYMDFVATCADTQADLVELVDSLRESKPVASGALLVKRKHGREIAYD